MNTEEANEDRFYCHVDMMATMASNADSLVELEKNTLSTAAITAFDHLNEAKVAAKAAFNETQEVQS